MNTDEVGISCFFDHRLFQSMYFFKSSGRLTIFKVARKYPVPYPFPFRSDFHSISRKPLLAVHGNRLFGPFRGTKGTQLNGIGIG